MSAELYDARSSGLPMMDSAFGHVTMSRSGRVRARKQHHRTATCIETSDYEQNNNIIDSRTRAETLLSEMHHPPHDEENLIPLSDCTKASDSNHVLKENGDPHVHSAGNPEKILSRSILNGSHLTPNRKRNSDCDTSEQNNNQRYSAISNSGEDNSLQEVRSKIAKYQLNKEDAPRENQSVSRESPEREKQSLAQTIARKSFVTKLSLRNSKKNIENDDKSPTDFTFEDMLKSKAAVTAFRDFLKSEYSEENLDFWLECEQYKGLKGAKQERAATKIFAQYMSRSALREINIDSSIRCRTQEKLKNPDRDCFIEAQNCIYTLMRSDPFRRFLSSEKYQKLSDSNEGFRLSLKRISTKKK